MPTDQKSVVQYFAAGTLQLSDKLFELKGEIQTRRVRGSKQLETLYLWEYVCPFCSQKHFQPPNGWTNAFTHMSKCGGVNRNLRQMYERAMEAGDITAEEPMAEATWHLINLLTECNLPLGLVDKKSFKEIIKYSEIPCMKSLRKYMINLVEVVKKQIAKELPDVFALLTGDWTSGSRHYCGMIAVYTKPYQANEKSEMVTKYQLKFDLLSVTTMAKPKDASDSSSDAERGTGKEATTFCAKTHVDHFFTILNSYYGKHFGNVACLIGINCNLNKAISRLMGVPLVGCNSHKLDLEVSNWFRNPTIAPVADKIKNLMETVKGSRRLLEQLRKLSDKSAKLPKETRWLGMCNMFGQYVKVRTELDQMDDLTELQLTKREDRTVDSVMKVVRILKSFSVEMQTKDKSLYGARKMLNVLIKACLEKEEEGFEYLYKCGLERKYISAYANMVADSHFESGVCKIQKGMSAKMTPAEKAACFCLATDYVPMFQAPHDPRGRSRHSTLKDRSDESDNKDELPESPPAKRPCLSYCDVLLKRFESPSTMKKDKELYINCDFILGNAAEIECLWSKAALIMSNRRQSNCPLVLECLLFLHYNKERWEDNPQLVKQAMAMEWNSKKLEPHLQQYDDDSALDDFLNEDEEAVDASQKYPDFAFPNYSQDLPVTATIS